MPKTKLSESSKLKGHYASSRSKKKPPKHVRKGSSKKSK